MPGRALPLTCPRWSGTESKRPQVPGGVQGVRGFPVPPHTPTPPSLLGFAGPQRRGSRSHPFDSREDGFRHHLFLFHWFYWFYCLNRIWERKGRRVLIQPRCTTILSDRELGSHQALAQESMSFLTPHRADSSPRAAHVWPKNKQKKQVCAPPSNHIPLPCLPPGFCHCQALLPSFTASSGPGQDIHPLAQRSE